MPIAMEAWPVLTHYEGEYLREIAFPLGGIGTGTVCLGGRAELRDFELTNRYAKGMNPPYCFFALRAQAEGRPAVTRVLEGVLQPPYGGAFGVASPLAGLPRMREVALDACYPFARYTLADAALPLSVRLEAFNPLIPQDAERSGLPVAVLRYVLVNQSDCPVRAAMAGSLYNFIGAEAGRGEHAATVAPGSLGRLLGGNINEVRRGEGLVGLLMRSTKVPAHTPEDGTLALTVLADEATCRRTWGATHWNRHILTFWDDFSDDGRLDDPAVVEPSPEGQGQIGSLAVEVEVPAGGERAVTFLLSWHFPHRTAAGCGWETTDPAGGWVGNYYARRYADAWDVAVQTAPELEALEAGSLRFARAFAGSTLPQPVKEAALNNLSTLRSQTCFRTADGGFYGFEGGCDDRGCCFGFCTHVWNYEQATAFLFPELARSMRENELQQGTLPGGMNCFRLRLPPGGEPWPHAAADGQMGLVMKCYRDWQLTGDDAWLRREWPLIRSLLRYAWLPGGWDADRDGVMEGVQHNTYDVEFYGPNPLCGIYYLGALRAGEEMARALGDGEFAAQCADLFRRGSAWIDEHLFNGEYYIQQIRTPATLEETRPELRAGMGETSLANPDFQLGNGCLVDQLVGQYLAHVAGLGYLLDPEHVRVALRSLFRYNFKTDLYEHWNNMRTFALADEAALLIATWPHGDRPRIPLPYFGEAMTGFEYQAAAHMIYEGLVEEGLAVAAAVRARFDGRRRNPWDEQECGHHYARAMASWALVPALSGFHYSAPQRALWLEPMLGGDDFRCFFSVPGAWGTVSLQGDAARVEVLWGRLALDRLIVGAKTCPVAAVSVAAGETVEVRLSQP